MESASHLARLGLKLPPGEAPSAAEAYVCSACQTTQAAGRPRKDWKPKPYSFTDWLALRPGVQGRLSLCADCLPFFSMPVLLATQSLVVNREGAWSLSKDAHRAWFLTTPPAPPFVAMIGDATMQHLVWRARVSYSRELIAVQIGRSSLLIDRPWMLEAVQWARRAAEIGRALGLRVVSQHPFQRLSRHRNDLSDVAHGSMRADYLACASDHPELRDLLARLQQLGTGELWALAHLTKRKQEAPSALPIARPWLESCDV
ncbi:CRISPR type AFERR-associated protein Csf1 [Thiorhodovibrio winogradskyi]|uniref:CRISPR type AFERR-associated protein Csf1 n=2 Tax=Thiorhodovibrio winogradskyi TaxID=77007 RepID=A0ABZ0SH93_9GAMM